MASLSHPKDADYQKAFVYYQHANKHMNIKICATSCCVTVKSKPVCK